MRKRRKGFGRQNMRRKRCGQKSEDVEKLGRRKARTRRWEMKM